MIKQADLQSLNTLAIPARAQFLQYVENLEELHAALDFARRQRLKTLVLGEGSNIVLSGDYSGLVICQRIKGIEEIDRHGDQILIRVAAGENWHQFVEYCLEQGWYGLENLALIPGLVGAAPIQNIGAYGVELKDIFSSLEYIDIQTGESHRLQNHECQFAYRHSIFKGFLKDRVVITHLTVKLSTKAKVVLEYSALSELVGNKATPIDVFQAVCELRKAKLPDPANVPNAGSFFKNPVVDHRQLEKIKAKYPNVVSFPFEGSFKLAAAWLIEHRGWKDRCHAGVQIHKNQALVIINPESASGDEVLNFAQQIQRDIHSNFDVSLEIEPVVM